MFAIKSNTDFTRNIIIDITSWVTMAMDENIILSYFLNITLVKAKVDFFYNSEGFK